MVFFPFFSFLRCVRVLLIAVVVPSSCIPPPPSLPHITQEGGGSILFFSLSKMPSPFLLSLPPLPSFLFTDSKRLEHLLGRRDGGVDVGLGVRQGHEARLVLGGGQVEATLEHATVPLGELSLREREIGRERGRRRVRLLHRRRKGGKWGTRGKDSLR